MLSGRPNRRGSVKKKAGLHLWCYYIFFVDEIAGKEKSAFLLWVSSIDFEKVHQDTYAKKHAQTCDWLINEPKYQQWFNNPDSSLLWSHGKRKQCFIC
jgi:hypothetical protein